MGISYHRRHGYMHSTSERPSHSERGSGVPCMWWPLSRMGVFVLPLVLLPFLFLSIPPILLIFGRRRRAEQRRWVQG